jgi:hypothetical protein
MWLTLKLETPHARIFRFEVSFSNPVTIGEKSVTSTPEELQALDEAHPPPGR